MLNDNANDDKCKSLPIFSDCRSMGSKKMASDARLLDKEVVMRVAVYGTGGIGGYFGGRLAQAGEDVVFIARGEHLRAICEEGLKVDSIKGDFVIQPAQATESPGEIGAVDLVLLGVKAWQVPEAAEAMRPMIGPETVVLPTQNGVEAAPQLVAALGRQHVLGGVAKIISFIASPGHITHAGAEPFLAFAELDNIPSERTERLRQMFTTAGVLVKIPKDIHAAIWEKFLMVAAWGGVGAAARVPVGVLRRLPESRELLKRAMVEISRVAQARQIQLPEEAVEKALSFIDALPESATNSLQRDIAEGKPSELEAWNGAVVRLGREVGVETPVNEVIYACLLPLERQCRGAL